MRAEGSPEEVAALAEQFFETARHFRHVADQAQRMRQAARAMSEAQRTVDFLPGSRDDAH